MLRAVLPPPLETGMMWSYSRFYTAAAFSAFAFVSAPDFPADCGWNCVAASPGGKSSGLTESM